MRKLIKQIYNDYKSNYEFIVKNNDLTRNETIEFLQSINLHKGICLFVGYRYKMNIYNYDWIRKYKKKDNYWFITPIDCSTKEGILITLKYRINKLEEVLKSNKESKSTARTVKRSLLQTQIKTN